jgi:hypothetical protein
MKLISSILVASRLVVLAGGLTLLAGCGGETTTGPDQIKEQMQADENRANAMQNAAAAAKTKKAR